MRYVSNSLEIFPLSVFKLFQVEVYEPANEPEQSTIDVKIPDINAQEEPADAHNIMADDAINQSATDIEPEAINDPQLMPNSDDAFEEVSADPMFCEDVNETPEDDDTKPGIESTSNFGSLLPARESSHELIRAMYENDLSEEKVFLAAREFRTNEGKSWRLPVVRTVEAQIAEDLTIHKEFTPNNTGMPCLVDAVTRLLLGNDCAAFLDNRVSGVQAPSGEAAAYLGLSVLKHIYHFTTIYLPNPIIGPYEEIGGQLGYSVRNYEYMDQDLHYFDMEVLLQTLEEADEESIVVFNIDCSHKPNKQEWIFLLQLMKRRHLFPLFLVDGQGLSSGDIPNDLYPVRLFANDGQDLMVAQSFDNIFGLGDEHLGLICIVGPDAEETRILDKSLRYMVNTLCGYTANKAARIVVTTINNPALTAEWQEHIRTMAQRVRTLRLMFFQKLLAAGTAWYHVQNQTGMYLLTGLTDNQMTILRQKYHIYMYANSFLNLSCLASTNVDYVTQSIHNVASMDMEESVSLNTES